MMSMPHGDGNKQKRQIKNNGMKRKTTHMKKKCKEKNYGWYRIGILKHFNVIKKLEKFSPVF